MESKWRCLVYPLNVSPGKQTQAISRLMFQKRSQHCLKYSKIFQYSKFRDLSVIYWLWQRNLNETWLNLVEFLLKLAFPRVWWVTLHAALVESFTASFVAQIICGLLNFSQTFFRSHEARTRETLETNTLNDLPMFDSGRTSVLILKTNRFCYSIWNEYTPISPSSRQNQMNSVCTNVFETCLCNSSLFIWAEMRGTWADGISVSRVRVSVWSSQLLTGETPSEGHGMCLVIQASLLLPRLTVSDLNKSLTLSIKL